MGDSLSAAHGIPRDKGWVTLLESRLADQGYPYRVVNASISGETTRGGLTRLPRALDKHNPNIVIIALGGNDGLRGIPIDEMRANLAAMIEKSRQAGAEVLLAGVYLPANYGQRFTEKFRNTYKTLAEEYDIAWLPFILEGVALNSELMQDDRIHPNAAGQPRLLDNVWGELEPLLETKKAAGD